MKTGEPRADLSACGTLDIGAEPGLGTMELLPAGVSTKMMLSSMDPQHLTVANPFFAELGLLTKLLEPRASGKKYSASMAVPKPVATGPGGKRQAVPALSDSEVAFGEVQSLPGYGKLHPGQSSTRHAGLKEMQISRKARHEAATEAYHINDASLKPKPPVRHMRFCYSRLIRN